MSQRALRRYRAERLLRKEFTGLRSKVLAIVGSRLHSVGATLDVADLEACYAQAWHGLYATVLDGEQVENPSAWLVLVTFRRAIDESRSAGRRRLADTPLRGADGGEHSDDTPLVAPDRRQPVAFSPDLAGALDDQARLQQLLEGLRSRLSERECRAASLCYVQGLSRSEAAERMGITRSRMRKLMEGAGPSRPGVASKVGELLDTIRGGGWCEQQGSLMRAFAFGILDPDGERYAMATIHQRECPACRAYVLSLRGLAAVLPPLPLPLAVAGVAGLAGSLARGTGVHLAPRASVPAGSVGVAGASGAGSGLAGSGLINGSPLVAKLTIAGVLLASGGAGVALIVSVREHPHSRSGAHARVDAGARLVEGAPAYRELATRRIKGYDIAARTSTGAGAIREFGPEWAGPVEARHGATFAPGSSAPATREFGPERAGPVQAPHGAATAPAPPPPVSVQPAGPPGEFGFE